MAAGQKNAPTLADFEEFSLIVNMIAAKSRSALQAAPFAEDPVAMLQAGKDTVDILYRKFEKSAFRLLDEQRGLGETLEAFFARISSLSEDELLARMLRDTKGKV